MYIPGLRIDTHVEHSCLPTAITCRPDIVVKTTHKHISVWQLLETLKTVDILEIGKTLTMISGWQNTKISVNMAALPPNGNC
jgi:hypothetical protein